VIRGVPVSPQVRARVLRFASALTREPDNAAAVAVNASPLLAWLEAASSPQDMRARLRALSQHHQDTALAVPDDNPDRFLAGARMLYAFMTADAEQPRDDGARSDLREKLRRLHGLGQEDS
jgi:hypothetical protein